MEDQMLIEKPAEYPLTGQRVAVVIDTDLTIHYEHPGISTLIAGAVAGRISINVENVEVLYISAFFILGDFRIFHIM